MPSTTPDKERTRSAASGARPQVDSPAASAHTSRLSTRSVRTRPMRLIRRILSERKPLFASALGLRLVKDLLPFQGPILIGIIVDLLSGTDRSLLGFDFATNSGRAIVILALLLATLEVVEAATDYVHKIVSAHLNRHVVQSARRDLAVASMQMSLDERRRFNSGDLLDRCLADSKDLSGFTQDVIIRVISNTVRAAFPVTVLFIISPLMAVVVLSVIPVQSLLSGLLQRRLHRQTREARQREAIHTSTVKEAIDGWNSLASVGGQQWITEGMFDTAAAAESAKMAKKRTNALIGVVIALCTGFGIAAAYAIGGLRIIDSGALDPGGAAAGALTLGSLTTFVGVANKTYAPFRAFTNIVSAYREGLVNLERIAEVLDAPMIDPRLNGPPLRVATGDVTLNDVTFRYSGMAEPILRGLSGTIPGRSLTIITGSSGSGKTTLLRLLLGLDVPTRGTISIDGQDINAARFESLQRAVSLVPQEPVLFTGTLRENLAFGLQGVSTKDLLEVCDRAGLLDVVRELPHGLDTEVGSGRHMFSGGQLRRMVIARSLMRNPAILLLDEPTNGLDKEASDRVLRTLKSISAQTTVIMVSHLPDPLRISDHHWNLSNGGWAEQSLAPAPTAAAPFVSATNGTTPMVDHAANGHRDHPPHLTVSGAGRAGTSDVLALSAMGRPILLHRVDDDAGAVRAMLISGHRSNAAALPEVVRLAATRIATEHAGRIALGAIEDLNPDGEFSMTSAARTTALGVAIEADHQRCRASETRALHAALRASRAAVLIDVAAAAASDAATSSVVLRFVPGPDGAVPSCDLALARSVRDHLDGTPFAYAVSLRAATSDSARAALGVAVVEITVPSPVLHEAAVAAVQAVCDAVEATSGAAYPSSIG